MVWETNGNEVEDLLGARIAVLRRNAGMNQQTLAARLGVSTSAVGMYEQGRREPSGETLVKLAQIFDVTTDFLLTGRVDSQIQKDGLCKLLLEQITTADRRLEKRPDRPFSRQELAVLMAAMLMDREP